MLEVYQNKNIFITGNTGFKGSWLAALFQKLKVHVEGYALIPETTPNHFNLLQTGYKTTFANILDREKLADSISEAKPDIIFHLAAQALVRHSYADPFHTYESNVMGTLNVLEAARKCKSVKAIVLITTDKVYENKESKIPYSESDELGGYDIYSSSKACCEILIRSYRNSFFNISDYKKQHNVLIASARAGNVIGGGDWNKDRLIPDIAVAAAHNRKVLLRNPKSIRPWQHVLDCLYGYLILGAKLLQQKENFSGAWNFSPFNNESKNVEEIALIAKKEWDDIDIGFGAVSENLHEASLLTLDNSKAVEQLQWKPLWDAKQAVEKTIAWYKAFYQDNKILTEIQIIDYLNNVNN